MGSATAAIMGLASDQFVRCVRGDQSQAYCVFQIYFAASLNGFRRSCSGSPTWHTASSCCCCWCAGAAAAATRLVLLLLVVLLLLLLGVV